MRRLHAAMTILAALLTATLAPGSDDDPPAPATPKPASPGDTKTEDGLATTAAVACKSIDGYEKYEVLPDATLTADEKLLVYYRPLNYRVEKLKETYHVHLTQDGQIRKRGEKAVLLRKEKLLDYEFKVDYPPNPVFLRNTVALKGLKPGEYEFDIILHDKLAEGRSVTRTLSFKVVAAVLPRAEVEPETSDSPPAPAPKARTKARKKASRR